MQLEERYLIVKIADIEPEQLARLNHYFQNQGIPIRAGVVVEKDWPEYEPTIAAIAARVDGKW